MPRFYTVTEADALAHISRHWHLPQKPAEHVPQFSDVDAYLLSQITDGTSSFTSRARNDADQPLFRPPSVAVQPIEQLLSASGFSMFHGTTHRDKITHGTSLSEGPTKWKARSRTPSSDEASQRKTAMSSPTSSSSDNGSLENGVTHMTGPKNQKREYNWGLYPEYYATFPEDILQNMDTQFSKWSYDLNEGTTAIPFVMAEASPETHSKLVEVDRNLWAGNNGCTVDDPAYESNPVIAKAIESLQRSSRGPVTPTKYKGVKEDHGSDKEHNKDTSLTNRAALIAKRKATSNSSVISTKSASQKRSAMHKSKNRRSIMSSPTTVRKEESESTIKSSTSQTRPNILLLSQNEEEQRRDVDSALQDNRIDFDDAQHLRELMNRLGKGLNTDKAETSREQVLGVGDEAGKPSKSQRLKGKTRKGARATATQ